MKSFHNIEKYVFIPTLILTVLVAVVLIFFKEQAQYISDILFAICTQKFGWLYYLACISCFIFLVWLTISPVGKIKLGDPKDEPQYRTFSWIAMLFTAGVGTSIVIMGFLEPIYYVSEPPFHMEPYSVEAYEYAHMYGQFHWGPSAWAFYVPAIVAVGYSIFVQKKEKLSLSSACEDAFAKKKRVHFFGIVVDVLVVLGILGSIATSLGIGTPVLSIIVRDVFSIPQKYELIVNFIILGIWVCIFGGAAYLGLDRGIKKLSDFNLVLAIVFLVFVFVCADSVNIMEMEINSVGLYFSEFVRLNTWMDPFGDGAFVENWTVFYWGWWLAFMPMMGMFIARISKGRTIRSVVWGQLLFGSLGCALNFMVFGGYALQVQQSGLVDVAGILSEQGQAEAVIAILSTLPMKKISMLFMCVLCFIYLATTIDSCAFVLASSTTKKIKYNEEPAGWNRLLWALLFCVLSIGLLLIKEFRVVQLMSIVVGFPLIAVVGILIVACIKMLQRHK